MSSPDPEEWVSPAWLRAEWAIEDAWRDSQWSTEVSTPRSAEAEPPAVQNFERLLALDPASLDPSEQIDHLVALEAQKRRVDAAQARLLGVMAAADSSDEHLLTVDVSLALRLSAFAADRLIDHAHRLTSSLPATLAAVDAGSISLRHADVLCDAADRLDPASHSELEARLLTRAGSQTRAELARSANRAVLAIDPGGAQRRHRRAVADRCLVKYPDLDGMATLTYRGPATDVITVYARIDAAAHLLPAQDPRSMDQKRADLFVDAVLAGIPVDGLPTRHGRAPAAEITVSLSTLLGFDDEPAELSGYGPITAGVARQVATEPDATWRRIVTDPVTGSVLDYGRRTYRPPAGLRDHVIARDRVCVAPGCARPARLCDLDHVVAWDDGGPTSSANLAALCGRHHGAKTKNHLTYRRDADGGYTWTTRTGHRYQTPPPEQ